MDMVFAIQLNKILCYLNQWAIICCETTYFTNLTAVIVKELICQHQWNSYIVFYSGF